VRCSAIWLQESSKTDGQDGYVVSCMKYVQMYYKEDLVVDDERKDDDKE
jgi:hypothetical protein